MPRQIDRPLAADLSVLPDRAIASIREIIAYAIELSDCGDTSSPEDFRGAYALALHLAPIAGFSKTEVAQLSNTSLSTFNRWLCAGSDVKPHKAHVAGLFFGLRKVAQTAQEALEPAPGLDQNSFTSESKSSLSNAVESQIEMVD